MFRILFAPKATPGKGEIHVADMVYVNFNIFKIDTEKKLLKFGFESNVENGHTDINQAMDYMSWSWGIKNLEYEFKGSSYVEIKIPDGYEVMVILK